jgi:hypothetical protein
MGMSGDDPIAITALMVSLVALIVTLLQAAQQYAATANDYRHCSKRTVGGWARQSHRKFIWNELRFEVVFVTPTISIYPRPSSYAIPLGQHASEKAPILPTSAPILPTSTPPSSPISDTLYHLVTQEGKVRYTFAENPWFLSLEGTRVEARSSWLSLLHDASTTSLQIDIEQRKLSYDFMPDGIKRPLARIDRKSFVTLMSLFRVQWQGDDLTGAGEFCEVTRRDLVNFGTVYSYRSSDVQQRPTYYIVSENARSAMFNWFDLGFHVVRTHTSDEVYESLLGFVEEEVASTVRSFNAGNGGWSPGLSETIACFAEPSMPKAINHGADSFTSIFSSRSTASFFGDRPVLKLLCGEDVDNATRDTDTLRKWATDYLSSESSKKFVPVHRVIAMIKSACLRDEPGGRPPVPWSESRECLDLVRALDEHLRNLMQCLAPTNELQIQRELARMQVRLGCKLFLDTTQLAKPNGFWRDHIPSAVAGYYTKIGCDLAATFPDGDPQVLQSIVMNRLMRGALWHIHNGNSSNQDGRRLECSLNSRWLADASTVWID